MRLTNHFPMTTIMIPTVLVAILSLQGCAFLAGAVAGGAAGGAVGYGLADNGYEVQSPITRPAEP